MVEEQIRRAGVYSWKEGQLWSNTPSKAVNTLHAKPTLLQNVRELCKLQAMLSRVVADLVWAKEVRRPSEVKQQVKCTEFKYFCDRWDSLKFNGDGLLMIMLATGANHQDVRR